MNAKINKRKVTSLRHNMAQWRGKDISKLLTYRLVRKMFRFLVVPRKAGTISSGLLFFKRLRKENNNLNGTFYNVAGTIMAQ